jgi:hypothetical protein
MKLATAMLIGALVGSCRPSVVPPPDAVDDVDAEDARSSPCARACVRLRELHCPEAERSRSGTSCVDVCQNAGALLDPACVARATTVDAVHACRVRCVP